MARAYGSAGPNVSVSAAVDMHSLQTTSGMVAEIDQFNANQVTATSVGNLRITFKRFSGAYSIGSGGTAGTVNPHVFGDAAATCTTRYDDTTQTTSGTSKTLLADAMNVINGYQWLPPPEDRWSFTISQAFVASLDQAPGSAETFSNSVQFRETV